MANYNSLKNAALIAPTTTPDLGSETNRYGNVYMSGNINMSGTSLTSNNVITPKVSSVSYPGDDTAADIAGGQTLTLTGTGFAAGTSILVNGSVSASSVSVLSDTSITFTAPAMAAGTYVLYLINPDGGTAISIPGISYSGVPTWSTSAGSLGSIVAGSSFSATLAAAGDAPVTYSVASGSLPSGISLNSSTGFLSGTAPNETASTTYTFTIKASDAQNQDTSRSFSLTVAPGIVATGGTITTVDGYKIHTFTSGGTFSVTAAPVGASVQYLVVGGGGGGFRGGGGGGGVLYGSLVTPVGNCAVTIGAGGAFNSGTTGGNSTVQVNGTTYTAFGGGNGTDMDRPPLQGKAGGSGGGTGNNNDGSGSVAGGIKTQTTQGTLTGYGNNGGAGGNAGNNPPYPAGGGGGAGAAGGSAAAGTAGAGGVGIINPIVGSTRGQLYNGQYYLAGGGGGSADSSGAAGGLGGSGHGGDFSNTSPDYMNGTNNTGGGGGGISRAGAGVPGLVYGGSGIVIIRYQA